MNSHYLYFHFPLSGEGRYFALWLPIGYTPDAKWLKTLTAHLELWKPYMMSDDTDKTAWIEH